MKTMLVFVVIFIYSICHLFLPYILMLIVISLYDGAETIVRGNFERLPRWRCTNNLCLLQL